MTRGQNFGRIADELEDPVGFEARLLQREVRRADAANGQKVLAANGDRDRVEFDAGGVDFDDGFELVEAGGLGTTQGTEERQRSDGQGSKRQEFLHGRLPMAR